MAFIRSIIANVLADVPTMTLKTSKRWTGSQESFYLSTGKYFVIVECEGTVTPIISAYDTVFNNVIAVPRSSSSTSRSIYAWTFTISETYVAITGSGWTNAYIFTY